MWCQTFDAPLGAKPVMTLIGSVQTTTLVVVMIAVNYRLAHQSLLLEEKVPPKGADVV